jgi:predicted nuclease of predicted toxin-antitoxin system
MKLPFDQNLSFKLCQQLADIFPGSSQARLAGLEAADDRAVWRFAAANGFTLVSYDADFCRNGDFHRATTERDLVRRGNQSTGGRSVAARACRGDPRTRKQRRDMPRDLLTGSKVQLNDGPLAFTPPRFASPSCRAEIRPPPPRASPVPSPRAAHGTTGHRAPAPRPA